MHALAILKPHPIRHV